MRTAPPERVSFFVAPEPGSDVDDDHDGPWLVEGVLREGQGLLIDAESPGRGTTEARSLARCVAFGSPHLGHRPERTCAVAVVSPRSAPIRPPTSRDSRHVTCPVHLVVDLPFLDREVDRLEVARCFRRLSVDVAIFDPAGFADLRLSRIEREYQLVLAAEACLLVGVTPVFVLLREESSRA